MSQRKDDIVYYTFWPVTTFSFFLASDSVKNNVLVPARTQSALAALIMATTHFVHLLSINTLVLSLIQAYFNFTLFKNSITYSYIEYNAIAAAMVLCILTFLSSIAPLAATDNILMSSVTDTARFFATFIPWLFCTSLLIICITRMYSSMSRANA